MSLKSAQRFCDIDMHISKDHIAFMLHGRTSTIQVYELSMFFTLDRHALKLDML